MDTVSKMFLGAAYSISRRFRTLLGYTLLLRRHTDCELLYYLYVVFFAVLFHIYFIDISYCVLCDEYVVQPCVLILF